ncbi:hypothetical protein JM658_06770 [Joostella atrarenae]|uniref:Lipocalin-like domain-containing protein n=1 Tax=Joostella atrarenae TaxID=679257 RepID=A0ABS9J285_9FLAO|nr:hypothetical protein [Joostella atrarenae]MCF8714531.1 hypothetical protein [Joostella atrarenae]
MKNKIAVIYLLSFTLIIVTIALVLKSSTSPNKEIVGVWEETSWRYEKLPVKNNKYIDEAIKKDITAGLIIHEAETWEFLPNGEVLLSSDDIKKKLEWRLKGRGHILKLKYPDFKNEHYNLYKINDKEMELHFQSDIQARGIVKLTFKKKEAIDYVEKI